MWQSVASALTFVWQPPDGYVPEGYLFFHGISSGDYSDITSIGNVSTFDYNFTMQDGANFFTVTALTYDTNHVLWMSPLSNEAIITNSTLIVLTAVTMTSTNIGATNWMTWNTNQIKFQPDLPQQLFMNAPLQISTTSIITFPTNVFDTNSALKSPSITVKKPKK